jgi:hypothetical protein
MKIEFTKTIFPNKLLKIQNKKNIIHDDKFMSLMYGNYYLKKLEKNKKFSTNSM